MDTKPVNCFNVLPRVDCCFYVDTYKEKKYFAIRMWVQKANGDWIPTKKGVNIELEHWNKFNQALEVLDKDIYIDISNRTI